MWSDWSEKNDKLVEFSSFSIDGGDKVHLFPTEEAAQRGIWIGSEILHDKSFVNSFEEKPLCLLSSHQISSGRAMTPSVVLPQDAFSQKNLGIEIELDEFDLEWQKVADFSFEKGARSQGWTLDDWQLSEAGLRETVLRLSERRQHNWLRGDSGFIGEQRMVVVVFDEKLKTCLLASSISPVRSVGALSAMNWRGLEARFYSDNRSLLDFDLAHCRILVFEPSAKRGRRFGWKGEVKVTPSSKGNNKRARGKRVLSLDKFEVWLGEHPVPQTGISERELAQYLVELLKVTTQLQGHLPSEHVVEQGLAYFVEEHLVLFQRALQELALNQHYSRRLLRRSLARGLSEKSFRVHLEELIGIPEVREKARERGWFDSLADVLVRGARGGNERMLKEAVLLPQRAGLSNEECLMFFNRRPRVDLYRALSKDPELRELLDQGIEKALSSSLRQISVFHGDVDEVLRIALASGHPNAPQLWQEMLRRATTKGEQVKHFDGFYKQYFEVDRSTFESSRWLQEFLEMDAKQWVFDEEKKRFRVREVELEGESS